MTATLYPSQRIARINRRAVGVPSTRPSSGASTGPMTDSNGTVPCSANYAARRAVAGFLALLLVAIVAVAGAELLGALVDGGARPAVASVGAAGDAPGVRIHVAQPGDTMWSIADRYRGEVGHGRFVDALIDVNGGTVIQIGQAVRLP